MPFFVWVDDLKVGVPELDGHHKKLVSLINALHDAVEQGAAAAALQEKVDAFREYARVHFRAEEAYMKRTRHENLAVHKRQHQEFALSMATWTDQLSEGDLQAAHRALDFLKKWFLDHVQHEDRAYAPHPGGR